MAKTFTPAEYQLISMEISYEAEKIVMRTKEGNEDRIPYLMLREYREWLDDKSISFVEGVPQYSKEKVTIENYRGGAIEKETGFHMNAITKGSPDNPDQIVITFPGTDFSDVEDAQQTIGRQGIRTVDYSQRALDYVEEVKRKYPKAKITVTGHSMSGKLAIQIGIVHPDVEVYAFNPTAIDRKYSKQMDGKTYDNINMFIFDKEIARNERAFQYALMFTTTGRLPFNTYHVDSKGSIKANPFMKEKWLEDHLHGIRNRKHAGPIEQHSTGGFRGVDGRLWDVYSITPIDFAAGSDGTKPIKFDKERYQHFANVLKHEIAPSFRRAMDLLGQMEEDLHKSIKSVIDRAETDIEQLPMESEDIKNGDPRIGAVESLRTERFKGGKYRCYDQEKLSRLLDALDGVYQRMMEVTDVIMETSNDFEVREMTLAQAMSAYKGEY